MPILDMDEIEEEEGKPDHPVEWPKNDRVPDDGDPLPESEWTPKAEDHP